MIQTASMQARTGPGGVAIKRCRTCQREVLSAYRGTVTAVGQGEIEKVEPDGTIVGRCSCGTRVVWHREVSRSR